MRPSLIGAALAASALSPSPALACSSCGCNLPSDWLTQGLLARTGTTIGLRYDDVPQTQLRTADRPVDPAEAALPADREIERYTFNHYATLTVDHQLDDRWGFDLQLPFLYRPHETFGEGETDPSFSHTGGLGDIRLSVRRQVSGAAGITGVQLGVKLPTGAFDQRFGSGPEAGEAVDRGLQPGTGTTDLTLGAYHFGPLAAHVGWLLQAQGQIALNDRDRYRPGDAVSVSAGIQYLGWKGLTPQLQLNARVAARDRGVNSDRENSGGEQLYLAPGLAAPLTTRLSGFAYAQLPLYQRVNGFQLAPRYTLSVGVQYRL